MGVEELLDRRITEFCLSSLSAQTIRYDSYRNGDRTFFGGVIARLPYGPAGGSQEFLIWYAPGTAYCRVDAGDGIQHVGQGSYRVALLDGCEKTELFIKSVEGSYEAVLFRDLKKESADPQGPEVSRYSTQKGHLFALADALGKMLKNV